MYDSAMLALISCGGAAQFQLQAPGVAVCMLCPCVHLQENAWAPDDTQKVTLRSIIASLYLLSYMALSETLITSIIRTRFLRESRQVVGHSIKASQESE
jgi:hypothetical protein